VSPLKKYDKPPSDIKLKNSIVSLLFVMDIPSLDGLVWEDVILSLHLLHVNKPVLPEKQPPTESLPPQI